MILHLLRHAKTEKLASSGKDFDRNLAQKGILQSQQLVNYFSQKSLKNTTIYVSAANRTVQTANLIFPNNNLQICRDLYLASAQQILAFLNTLQSTSDLFVIGHNEGISELASYLLGENIHLQTAGYLAISFSCANSAEISKQTGTILQTFRPEFIP